MQQIRLSQPHEVDAIQALYDIGYERQIQAGNLHQWAKGYPGKDRILADIEAGYSYVLVDNMTQEIYAVMALIPGQDPTYYKIYGGQWLNDQDYLTIHRIAASGRLKGAGKQMIQWSLAQTDNLRIDTHQANIPMQKVLKDLGFVYCGVIYLANGDERLAFQYSKNK